MSFHLLWISKDLWFFRAVYFLYISLGGLDPINWVLDMGRNLGGNNILVVSGADATSRANLEMAPLGSAYFRAEP